MDTSVVMPKVTMLPKLATGQCPALCPGNHRCTLRSGYPHTLHGCSDPDCYCHTQARFENDKTILREIAHNV
jgi:hypothetical protein